MPMQDTDIPCPDCDNYLTDVDGMLECQDVYESSPDGRLKKVKKTCGGSTGFTEDDWGVWYPGPGQRPNPKRLDFEQRGIETQELRNKNPT